MNSIFAYNESVTGGARDNFYNTERDEIMKKITSVLLALVLVISVFALASCAKKPQELLDEAAKLLEETPYTMTVKMDFETDNKEFNEIFKMMSMDVPLTVDGDDMSMEMSMDMMGQTIKNKMTLVDKVLYCDVQAGTVSQKMKTTLTDEQFADFKDEQSAEMPVDYSQFTELTAEKKDGKTVISCAGINDDGKKALNDEIGASLEELGGKAELGELSYVITLNKDGKYESMELKCTYTFEVEGESVTVDITVGADISYDDVDEIVAPSDADSYQSVKYSDIVGE